MKYNEELSTAVQQFTTKFHNVVKFDNNKNFVSSPLGVWLLIAQLAGANSDELSDDSRHKVEALLGLTLEQAYDYANQLLKETPDVIKTANAAWLNEHITFNSVENEWVNNLINSEAATVKTSMPSQEALDFWVKEKTLNIIDKFPLDVQPATVMVLANVLATKISWREPFEETEHDIEFWKTDTILEATMSHPQKIVEDLRTGEKFAVVSNSGSGLLVHSVIAENENLTEAQVLEVATMIARSDENIALVPTMDLVDSKLWTVEDIDMVSRDIYISYLPAWEAETSTDIVGLGFPIKEAAEAFTGQNSNDNVDMAQTAKAKFNKNGFEAAAVTAVMVTRTAMPARGLHKKVTTKFKHSYAVVASAFNARPHHAGEENWNYLPVFTSWVTTASPVVDEAF